MDNNKKLEFAKQSYEMYPHVVGFAETYIKELEKEVKRQQKEVRRLSKKIGGEATLAASERVARAARR